MQMRYPFWCRWLPLVSVLLSTSTATRLSSAGIGQILIEAYDCLACLTAALQSLTSLGFKSL